MARLCKACLLVFFALYAIGQASGPRIVIPLIAFGSHGEPTSLSVESLVITDQKLPIAGAVLMGGADLPLELGVLIDTSKSQSSARVGEILKAMNQFVTEVIRGPEDRVFLLTFGETQKMTEWLKKDQLRSTTLDVGVGGRTALYDSLAVACDQRLGLRDWTKPTRRVLVLVSDGRDNQSSKTLSEAISEAQKSGAVVFAIDAVKRTFPLSQLDQKMKYVQLGYLTEPTGGKFFADVSGEEIPKVFASVRELMEKMSYLTYAPANAWSQGLHEVVVKPVPKKQLQVSYARKYFWNP